MSLSRSYVIAWKNQTGVGPCGNIHRRRALTRRFAEAFPETTMIDHTGIGVADMGRSARFYDAALAALGLRRLMQMPPDAGTEGIGYGDKFPVFWIDLFHPHGVKQHTAFAAKSRKVVDAFHAASLGAGGRDNGPPGLRTGPGMPDGYYAAFVLDPDGNNIEAVCREG
jgi:catechol 2,3-dioxygenase-like lactoylglutathione lyase family enzyme